MAQEAKTLRSIVMSYFHSEVGTTSCMETKT